MATTTRQEQEDVVSESKEKPAIHSFIQLIIFDSRREGEKLCTDSLQLQIFFCLNVIVKWVEIDLNEHSVWS